jgi:hypothetical protein
VALSGDGSRVAIGAHMNDGNGTNAGHVRIYDLIANAWVQVGADIDGEAAGDFSGLFVALSGDGSRVAIGAHMNDGNGTNAGHVRIYDLIANAWVQVGADIDGEAADDRSGESVSLSGDGSRVAIGAQLNDGAGTDAGHVRIYDLIANAWVQVGADIDGEAAGDLSGRSVSLSGDGSRVAIGALLNDGNGIDAGHVRVHGFTLPNVSPVFTSGVAGSGVAGTVSNVYTAVASDADGNSLTYSLASAVAGFTINSSTGVVSMAAGVVAGSYVLAVVVSDGTVSVTQAVTVTVSPAAVLAETGSDIGGLSTGALALLILGLIAVAFTRRQEKGLVAS